MERIAPEAVSEVAMPRVWARVCWGDGDIFLLLGGGGFEMVVWFGGLGQWGMGGFLGFEVLDLLFFFSCDEGLGGGEGEIGEERM